ncbi:MAG: fibronectin type III domain-containing protein, partial [Ginsengibacter sp.]
MRKLLSFVLAFFAFYIANAQEAVVAKNPQVITGTLIKVTKPLRDFTLADKSIPDVIVRDEDGIIGKDEEFEEGSDPILYPTKTFAEDPALQKLYPSNPHKQSAIDRAITGNFLGMPYQPLNPPDPTMCAGPNHIIQMINGASGALFKVYNKSGGQVVAQTYLDAITGKGGLGDPIALYDHLADRFVLTEFANKPETGTEGLIVAITKTSDPAGQWYVYFFSTGNTFPDYPKFSVWPDAYYGTTNDFANASTYSGSSAYAFDRAKMLTGSGTVTMQRFTLGTTSKYFSMCPVGLEGTSLPPAGTGGLIAYMADDAWTASSSDVDSIGILEFKVDFVTPANTRVLTKASLATLAYKSDICTTTRGQCITQPGSATKVEALHQKIMDQPIYRNFAGYEGIVMSHVVDKGSNISGIRWYELHKTTGNWSVYQQSTYAPDNTHRWMPGICYDANGNIGLAYNVSSSATGVFAGARYTGRKQCDPLNTMTYSEDVIIAGAAANGSTRYGDYNQLVCDPDGVTFWFTCEYNTTSHWSTRIASFTLDPCNVTCGDPTGLTSSAITNTSATVGWVAVPNAVSYDVDYKLTTTSTWTNAATAIATTSKNISGLIQGTTYDWRVRANCSGGSGNYISAQFTTTLPCNAPAGLTTSSITSTSANISWSSAAGANSYDVEYKATSSSTWIGVVSGTTATSASLGGLAASTSYDWRVRSNCSSGSSSFSSTQFTTASAVGCADPSGLTASSITATSAVVSWSPVGGAIDYNVFYKATSVSGWSLGARNISGTSFMLSGLTASTNYTWRVKANCTSGGS